MAALLETDSQFQAVYALYRHDLLGYLLGAYVVQETVPGTFSMKYNRLLPENLERYSHRLDETDAELVRLLDELVLQNLYKKFKKKESSLQQFLDKLKENPHYRYILEYVERRVAKALPLLAEKNLFLMSKDGYPAYRRLLLEPEPAQVSYRIRRDENGLGYEARIDFRGNRLLLHEKPGGVVGVNPAWILHEERVIQVEDTPDGRRLKPFFLRPEVTVPKSSEVEYFQKFIRRLIADCEVEAEGFTVETVETPARFSLEIQSDNLGIVTLKPRVHYGEHALPVDAREKFRVVMEAEADFTLHRIRRDRTAEAHFTRFFETLRTDGASLIDFSLPEAKAHEWIAAHLPLLKEEGIEVIQKLGEEEFSFAQPELEYELVAMPPTPPFGSDGLSARALKPSHGEGGAAAIAPSAETVLTLTPSGPPEALLLRATVKIEQQGIPLQDLRPNILQSEGKVQLPDGRFAYLPQTWLDDFRHLMEVARPAEDGLRIAPYHVGILRAALRGKADVRADDFFAGFEEIARQPIPDHLSATLRDYQKAGYDWLCFLRTYHMGGILADDMGLGKTLQTLTLLQRAYEEGMEGPALVIVPNSLIYNWVAEAEKFTPNLRTLVYRGLKRADLVPDFFAHEIVITTYGTMRQDIDVLKTIPFQFVILDESHLIKNREAKTTRAVLELQGRHRLSLTGTPIENSTMDLWTQMEFLNPGLLGTAAFFERHYAQAIERDRNEERAAQLRILTQPFILRRTKDMVAKDLPGRVEQVQPCEMTPAQERLYTRTSSLYRKTLFQDKDESALVRNRLQVLSSIQRLRQIAIHPQLVDPLVRDSGKYEVAMELLEEVVAAGNKVLVFSQFVKLLRILQPDLKKRGIAHAFLDGSMRPEERAEEVERFQNDPSVPVFLISLKAGGVGLNLTAAQYVFLLDPWWNPAVEQQAINRAHRIGQDQTVFVYKFITRDSIEEKILLLQDRKLKLAQEVIRSEAQFFKNLSKADLEALFT